MASASAIIDRACQLTGLNSAASSTERVMALDILNNVYYRVVSETESTVASATYTVAATANDYDVSAVVGATPMKIRRIQSVVGGTTNDLTIVSEDEILNLREGVASPGITSLVAPMGTTKVMFYPNPNVGTVINTYYVGYPTALTDATSSSPTAVPTLYHWDVLLSGMVIDMLAKDQRIGDMQAWNGLYQDGLSRLKQHSASFLGEPYSISLPQQSPWRRYRDERSR